MLVLQLPVVQGFVYMVLLVMWAEEEVIIIKSSFRVGICASMPGFYFHVELVPSELHVHATVHRHVDFVRHVGYIDDHASVRRYT